MMCSNYELLAHVFQVHLGYGSQDLKKKRKTILDEQEHKFVLYNTGWFSKVATRHNIQYKRLDDKSILYILFVEFY